MTGDRGLVDLRSDTVTRPTQRMRAAMADADVGDDVYGEDPTVRRLEESVAEIAGKQAGLFLPSGTQSNLVALLTHCQRGEEYLVGADAHTYRFEAGGAAVLGSIQPQPLPLSARGTFDLDELRAAIKPDDAHFARSRLIALENTYHGRILPADHVQEVADLARERGLVLHLDGARAWNAAVASGVELRAITALFDSVSLCLSKGLGAPVGSVLVGSEQVVLEARRWRKMVGGGMRQAGVLAAAGLVAVEERGRLVEDHRRAAELARLLSRVEGLDCEPSQTETNMVFVGVDGRSAGDIARELRAVGVLISASRPRIRLVVHRDIDDVGIARVAEAFRKLVQSS